LIKIKLKVKKSQASCMKKNSYTRLVLTVIMLIIIASCGKEGAIGPQGAAGPLGATGAQGPKGDSGKDGTKFYSGNAAPSATIGVNGDFYINLSASVLYGPKTDAGWGNGISLKGANGAAGANGTNGTKIYSGTTPPAASVGVDGDFYFDLGAARLYGPKTAAGWGSGVSLRSNSSGKSITSFLFTGLIPAVTATINEADKTITANVPAGTPVTGLVPTIAVSDNASVTPASGVAQDFSTPVNYTVTAQDGSTQVYKLTVTVNKATTQVIDCDHVPAVLEDLGDGVDYIVKCNIGVGGVLTIKPGVTIQFDGEASGFTIGNGGALKMIGTSAKPIILEGKIASAGSWTGIQIASSNIENQWEYVTIKNGGAGKYKAGLLIGNHDNYSVYSSLTQMSIKHCTFSDNAGYGIWTYDSGGNDVSTTIFSAFESNTFTNNSLSALKASSDAIGKLDAKSSYINNGHKFIEIAGTLHNNTVVQALDAPYVVSGTINLAQKMTILPGVVMQFNVDAGLALGSGTLIANGTAAQPIKFTGYQPGVGYWLGLSLGNNDPQINLNYCIIDGAGSNKPNGSTACVSDTKGAVNFFPSCNNWTTAPVVTNCIISNSGGYGIVYKNGTTANFLNNTYSGNTEANVKAF